MSFDAAQNLLDEALGEGKIRGAAVCLGRAGEIVCELASGSAGTSTIFDIGTMTEPLATATVIMALASLNKINLNTSACSFWSDFSEDGKDKITLRHLLKHTSGLPADRPYYRELLQKHGDWAGTFRGAEFIFNQIAAESLEYPPTYAVIPSNIGFMVLGRVAEVIGAEPLDLIFAKNISAPLSLADTFFRVPPKKIEMCAASYFCEERKRMLRGEVEDLNSWAMGGVAGHAGLFSTAADAVRIAMALIRSLKHEGGPWPREAADEFVGPKAKYKLGWTTPAFTAPLCGNYFSRNTVGFTGSGCVSLWIDMDKETAVAIFALPAEGESKDAVKARKSFESILPDLHDALIADIA